MRKIGLLTTFWTALLFFPISGFALGLGDIEVSTYLNQPLKAQIEVVSARPGEVDDLLVSLASRDAFRKAGLDRPANLSKLRFKVEKSEDGQTATILVSTKTPVKEPFLNFLVEADWAKGRLLREFTILLDPPFFTQQPAPAPAVTSETPQPEAIAPVTPAAPQPIAEIINQEPEPASDDSYSPPQPIALTDEPPLEETVDESPAMDFQSVVGAPDSLTVEKGDTLWAIASQYQDGEHSMAQIMLAMQAMNPEAFGDDNINNLKVGAVLRAPDQDALNLLSKQEAYAQVLEQNGLWDDYVARKTGATVEGSPLDTDLEEPGMPVEDSEAQLSLLAPGDDESTSASLQDDLTVQGDTGQIRKQLALAEEELEAARLENVDLKSRIADLEQQVDKFQELQKLVQIEDDSLAQMQDSVAAEQEQMESAMTDADTIIDDGMREEGAAAVDDLMQPAEELAETADTMLSDESMGDTGAMMTDEGMTDTGPQLPEGMQDDTLSSEAETVMDTIPPEERELFGESAVDGEQQEDTVAPPPPPVIVTEAPDTLGGDDGILGFLPSLDSLLGDPIMLGGLGAILALLIGFFFLKRKRAAEEESDLMVDDGLDNLLDDDATPIHVPGAEEVANLEEDAVQLADTAVMDADESEVVDEPQLEVVEEPEDEFGSTAIISAEELPQPEEAPAPADDQDDVLNEVDVYLAYGLYDNAEELLKESLQNSPDRADYRAKLLDTHFATKNRDAFVKEAEALKSLGGAADRYWDRVQIMGFELDPDNDLFSDARDSGISAADLEYAKPETADFDIGSEEDITDFSGTDIDLGTESEDDFDAIATLDVAEGTGEITDTMTVPPPGHQTDEIELPSLGDDDETMLREEEPPEIEKMDLPDEIGDLGLDFDDVLEDAGQGEGEDDALNFDLPDDLDLSAADEDRTQEADSLTTLDITEGSDLGDHIPADDDEVEATDNLEIAFSEADEEPQAPVVDLDDQDDIEGTKHLEAALDMDMSDLENADLQTGSFSAVQEETRDDITEFKPAEVTGEFDVADLDTDVPLEELDVAAGLDKTDTFAPGDFNDEEDAGDRDTRDVEDISELMLPDDVDEVGTKLDLAKAFIDMGDAEGARSSLEEVMTEGSDEQKAEATDLLQKIK